MTLGLPRRPVAAPPEAVARLLRGDPGDASYGSPLAEFDARGGDVIVVSDLHLAAGRERGGSYTGTENFFADAAFQRWLRHLAGSVAGKPAATLVINGDFVDFIRVKRVPRRTGEGDEFDDWRTVLAGVGIERLADDLRQCVSHNEAVLGLKTHDYKSVWKLFAVQQGHPVVFDALAEWISAGHSVVISKGNHDLEWYWPAVRNYLRLVLAERLVAQRAAEGAPPLALRDALDVVLPAVRFADHLALVDDVLLEHGHRYETATMVVGEPTLAGGTELNLPFGSFFNRYLINQIELSLPFVDNVRPAENILPFLARERLGEAIKLLFRHYRLMQKNIPLRYARYFVGKVLALLLALLVPTVVILVVIVRDVVQWFGGGGSFAGFLLQAPLRLSEIAGGLVGAYLLVRIVSWFHLRPGPRQVDLATARLREEGWYARARILVLGHTHTPTQQETADGKWAFNTGTWIPVIESTSAAIRFDRTYMFLHLRRVDGVLAPGSVERWNDDAERPDPLVVLSPPPPQRLLRESGEIERAS